MFKVNKRNTRTRYEICLKLTIKTPERRQWHRSGVFVANFEHIPHIVLVFLLFTLTREIPAWNKNMKNEIDKLLSHWYNKIQKKTNAKYPFVNIKPVFNLQFPQGFPT